MRDLDPVDEARRLVRCMTAEERTRFLAWLVSSADAQRLPADARYPEHGAEGER